MPLVTEFKPVFTRHRTKALDKLTKEELVELLPRSMQAEIRRVEWAWKNIDRWSLGTMRIPATGQLVSELELTKEDILLLFDPDPEEFKVSGDSDDDNWLRYVSSDPVIWARIYLGLNPRIYQILLLRDPSNRKVLRLGRRCGKTTCMAIRMMFRSYTKAGNKSMLIAPMKSHLGVTWEMIAELAKNSPEMMEEFANPKFRKIEQPIYAMYFTNGSMIKCFTSGVRSNGNGDVLRGQEADDIYVDEVDMMSSNDLPSFSSIARDTGRGEKTMIIATTPNGRRDMLWKFCTELSIYNDEDGYGFKEFYFPTHADMNYSPRDDKEQRLMLTHQQYVHEILADFGEESVGVFMKQQITRALEHIPGGYDYIPLGVGYERDPYCKIVVGVDWDKFGAGTNIVVCSYDVRVPGPDSDENAGKIKVVSRYEIPRSMTTLTDGVEAILDINAQFHPDAIFVDRGYGETQIEMLQRAENEDHDPRANGMFDKLRGIAFQENIEIVNPVTKLASKKQTKDHMVTIAVKMFEDDRMILNKRDLENVPGSGRYGLIHQLEGYIQAGISIYGLPRYEASNSEIGDHALDALMLCGLAIDQRWGLFTRGKMATEAIPVKRSLMEVAGRSSMKMKEFLGADDTRKQNAIIERSTIKRGYNLKNLKGSSNRLNRTIMRGR